MYCTSLIIRHDHTLLRNVYLFNGANFAVYNNIISYSNKSLTCKLLLRNLQQFIRLHGGVVGAIRQYKIVQVQQANDKKSRARADILLGGGAFVM